MKNSERFLIAYNIIVKILNRVTQTKDEDEIIRCFSKKVKEVSQYNKTIRTYQDDLIEFHDLRNAIVHEKYDEVVIAEPNEWATKRIEEIVSILVSPPKVGILLKNKPALFELNFNDKISTALKNMSEKDYSQVPIHNKDGTISLLTSDKIIKWLGAIDIKEIIKFENIQIHQVLNSKEQNKKPIFISINDNIISIKQKFFEASNKGERIDAILITNSGKQNEKIINILAVEDLPKIEGILKKIRLKDEL